MEFMARVKRTHLPESDEQIIELELIRDTDTVEIHQGDEFVTVELAVDPFEG